MRLARQVFAIVLATVTVVCLYLVVRLAIEAARGSRGDLGRDGSLLFVLVFAFLAFFLGFAVWLLWPSRRS